mmetsp:Transcript_124127/g.362288  ORF Transcript_124127/g.362288 Transcript_124127/m.362288 type:complete len:182 (-) Transcript_124127:157-702(-)
MACCDCCSCKCYTVKPCCEEGAGPCGIFFCFQSKPRCRFCHKLYDQPIICPWHWCAKGQKSKTVGNTENMVCGGIFGLVGNFLAGTTLFVILATAHFRRDGNQAFKGLLNAAIFWGGVGSSVALGPLAIVIFAFLLCAGAIVDWFVAGRCDDCYKEPCHWLCAWCPCCGRKTDQEYEMVQP